MSPKAPQSALQLADFPSRPDLFALKFDYDEELQSRLKAECPGCRYAPELGHGMWAGPRELRAGITAIAAQADLRVVDKSTVPRQNRVQIANLDERLYPFQKEGVQRILQERGFMLSYEMGMGKTPPACQALSVVRPGRTLIITPAMVRLQWREEIRNWWPGAPKVVLVESGKQAKKLLEEWVEPLVVVTSYDLAVYFKDLKFDAVLADESHYLMSPKTGRSKVGFTIFERNHGGHRILLSGTPIMSRPHQIRHQLHCLYPHRYGGHWAFAERYCKMVESAYSRYLVPDGLDSEFAPELEARLALVSQRVTKKEYGHLLPPWQIIPIRVRANKKTTAVAKAFLAAKELSDLDDEMLKTLTSQKLATALEWATSALECEDHLCILTHFKDTAHEIAAELRSKHKGVLVRAIDGDITPKGRHGAIDAVLKAPRGVLIATMHCVKEGINTLVAFDQALLAEMYWSPGIMAQVLGRFYRVSGACNVYVLVIEGTQEEAIAWVLQKRMADAGKVIKKGAVEKELSAALFQAHNEKDELAELREIAANRIEVDEYGA